MKPLILCYLLVSSCYLFSQVPKKTIELGNGFKIYWYNKKDSHSWSKDQILVRTNTKGAEEIICAINDSSIIKEGTITSDVWPCKSFFGTDTICSIIVASMDLFFRVRNVYIFKKNNNGEWVFSNSYLKVIKLLDTSLYYNVCFLSHNIILVHYEADWHRPDEIIVLKDDNTIERYLKETLPATKSPASPDKH